MKPSQCSTNIEKWLYVVKNMRKLNTIPWAAQDELFAELSKVSNEAALTDTERDAYEESLRVYRDNLAVMNAAVNDAVREKTIQFARRLLARGMDAASVSELTELSVTEVEALR